MKKTVALVAALLLLAGVLAGCGDSQSTPEGVLKKFYTAINNMDAKSILECFPPDMQELMLEYWGGVDKIDLTGMRQTLGIASGSKLSVKINGVQMNGDRAVIDTTVSYDGVTQDADFPCIKIDGRWYFDYK